MNGQRIFPNKFGFLRLPEGGFGKDLKGRWWMRSPRGDAQIVAHNDVQECTDGMVTVSGYITKGVWR